MRPVWTFVGHGLYGLYAWIVLLTLCALVTACLLVVPSVQTRRHLARHTGRAIFRLCGIPVALHHSERLPADSCVVVANHASYLDGIVMTAALPPRFSFVIKREVTRVPVMHFLLRRLGSEFVTRADRHKGATDARRILRKAVTGQSLVFFPEGSFQRQPGIGRFRSGAFAAAQNAALPVVPVTIAGTRRILPAGNVLPRPGGRIDITVHPALTLSGQGREALIDVKDRSRAVIVSASGEPDLASHIGAG